MALADALALEPKLATAAAAPAADAAELLRLARWCQRYGPAGNRLGDDALWLDIGGAAHLFGGEAALLARIEADFARLGYSARPAAADTAAAAAALARFGPAQAIARIAPPGAAAAVLAPLPVEALGLAPDTTALLRRLGLGRLGQLMELPRVALERRFPRRDEAAAARLRLDRLFGLRDEPLAPLLPPAVFLSRRHFSAALLSLEAVEHSLPGLVADLVRQLEARHMGARRLALALWRVDGSAARVLAGTHAPCRDARHLVALLREKLARIEPGYGIDVVTLAAERVEPLQVAQSTLAAAVPGATAPPLDRLVDRLVNRLGDGRVAWLHPRPSHLPERAQRLAAVPPPADAWSLAPPAADALGRVPSGPVRPFLLLDPPEEVTVLAALPDEPPRQFTWRRVTRRVVAADGPERIAPEWWRELGGAGSRSRDYYRLETETDGCFWLFRDGLYGDAATATGPPRWYLHGVFA